MSVRKQIQISQIGSIVKITGLWDMDTNSQFSVAHGCDYTKIIGSSFQVSNNAQTEFNPLGSPTTALGPPGVGGGYMIDTTDVKATRANGSFFDTGNYSAAIITILIFLE